MDQKECIGYSYTPYSHLLVEKVQNVLLVTGTDSWLQNSAPTATPGAAKQGSEASINASCKKTHHYPVGCSRMFEPQS